MNDRLLKEKDLIIENCLEQLKLLESKLDESEQVIDELK